MAGECGFGGLRACRVWSRGKEDRSSSPNALGPEPISPAIRIGVIPGRVQREPGIHNHRMPCEACTELPARLTTSLRGYGFRAHSRCSKMATPFCARMPRNDELSKNFAAANCRTRSLTCTAVLGHSTCAKTDCSGTSSRTSPLQSVQLQKTTFFFPEIMIVYPDPVSQEGRFAVVTNVEAGCGGRVGAAAWISTRTTASMRTVKSRGPDTPKLVSSAMRASALSRYGGQKARRTGEIAKQPLDHRAGNAGCSRLNLWFLLPAFFPQAGHGCGQRPAFPVPSSQEGAGRKARLGRETRREIEIPCLTAVIASEAKQSRAALATLDCFVAALLAMTVPQGRPCDGNSISCSSCPGLTRASIFLRRVMDGRVKPGHDDRRDG